MQKIMGYLRLMRPANIVTAISDILAGVAISGYLTTDQREVMPIVMLILSTIGLYGGGVVMNDFFDAELDKKERPERPIPSGLISRNEAMGLGILLLLIGILSATILYRYNHSALSGILAVAIAMAALIYDKWGKHHSFFGPINMGLCRGLNLLLGISILPGILPEFIAVSLIPIIYIAAITMISRGEVHGGRKKTLFVAAFLYVVVMTCIVYVSISRDTLLDTLIFILIWAVLIFPPLKKAVAQPFGKQLGSAVKAGVIALIAMNAAWAAAFGTFYLALVIIVLLPISLLLAKLFAVT